jgi:hypothetical protein
MWEKTREEGSRRLKANAVPTVFNFSTPQRKRKAPLKRNLLPSSETEINISENLTISTSTTETSLEQTFDLSHGESSSQSALNSKMNSSSDTSIENTSLGKVNKKERLAMYAKLLQRKKSSLRQCKNKFRCSKLKIKHLEQQLKENRGENAAHLNKLFNQDQILALNKKKNKKSTKFMKWSNDTVTKALKLKFACGSSGYEELLKQNFPYPSVRTLQRRLKRLKFNSGTSILTEVFNFLKIKVESFNEIQKDCVFVLDEMAITPGKYYDTSMNMYFGDVTLPLHAGIATHVLVFMLAGINSRWKQMVAYYFTGNSVSGSVFQNIINSIFEKAAELKLNIISITSHMGACNQALWKKMQVGAGRHKVIKNYISNPTDSTKTVFFFLRIENI